MTSAGSALPCIKYRGMTVKLEGLIDSKAPLEDVLSTIRIE